MERLKKKGSKKENLGEDDGLTVNIVFGRFELDLKPDGKSKKTH